MLVFAWSLVAPALAAEGCATPRSVADSVVTWTRPGHFDPARASACMDVPPGADGGRLAVQLTQVLDARGLRMPVPMLPDAPDHTDVDGRSVVVPLPEALPELVIERAPDGSWRVTRATLEVLPELYAATFSPVALAFQSALPTWLGQRLLGVYPWQILYGLTMVVGATLIALLVRLLLRLQVRAVAVRARLPFDDAAYGRTDAPVVVLVLAALLAWSVPDLGLPSRWSSSLDSGLQVVAWVAGLLAAFRFVDVLARLARGWAATTESRLDDQLVPLLRQALQAVVVVLGAVFLAGAVGIDVWKLAAGVSIGGLAVALAAQDTVANMFGSLNIFVDRPFQIGDWVIIGDVEGVVEEVGFRSTRIRTFHNSLVTLPNSKITNANVDNMGARPRRRVKMTLSLTFDTPVDRLEAYVEGVSAILAAHPDVERTYEVHVYEIGASSLDILVYYHLVVPGWHEELRARSQNLLEFLRLADALGVSFAYPSTSVYVASTPSEPLVRPQDVSLDELSQTIDGFGPGGALARPEGPRFRRSWSVQARELQGTEGSVGLAGQE